MSDTVLQYIAYRSAPYRSAFDFSSPEEYEEYVRGVELRTLNGYLVKSFEELLIANYLTEHGVYFRYEQSYEIDTATKRHQQYRPDFYLPEYEIYIEHFALDRNGLPPPGWDNYAEGVAWKRGVHQDNGTRLIETHSWQQAQGTLFRRLHKRLEEACVVMEKVDTAELVNDLARRHISALARLNATFLTHAKGARLDLRELRRRAAESEDPKRAAGFLDIYEHIRELYEQYLTDEERALDFHDLVNRAAKLIEDGTWASPYRYILVDEFQDISAGRMSLLKALKRPGVAYFLVGDDWQSIYRFAGSDVQLMRNSKVHLGHVQERTLNRTFRFGPGVLGPSSAFIQANPEQTQRRLQPADRPEDKGVTVVSDLTPEGAFVTALQDIQESSGGNRRTVQVLGRYHKSGAMVNPAAARKALNVTFSTVHGAKGQEADYIVVLDLKDRRTGFPSRIEDDPLMELVLPPVSGKAFPVAEERRLFYVALTRARFGVYLAVDVARPSEFVTELLKLYPHLRQLGRPPVKCPGCSNGFLAPSKSRRTLLCSNRSCKVAAPSCSGCNLSYNIVVDGQAKCFNPICDNPAEVCPSCHSALVVARDGPRGPFWGCNAYWSEPPCRYTRPIRPQRRPVTRRNSAI